MSVAETQPLPERQPFLPDNCRVDLNGSASYKAAPAPQQPPQADPLDNGSAGAGDPEAPKNQGCRSLWLRFQQEISWHNLCILLVGIAIGVAIGIVTGKGSERENYENTTPTLTTTPGKCELQAPTLGLLVMGGLIRSHSHKHTHGDLLNLGKHGRQISPEFFPAGNKMDHRWENICSARLSHRCTARQVLFFCSLCIFYSATSLAAPLSSARAKWLGVWVSPPHSLTSPLFSRAPYAGRVTIPVQLSYYSHPSRCCLDLLQSLSSDLLSLYHPPPPFHYLLNI
ncbi:uncharacterized protein LOC116406448 isoform X2 [Xenopus tropicalis]|uniref:Uncharacterized protein LOC116406448 isoform X2 n=1 Tax=Xenopus tropicalis TaxID=8364 RepID=A0A8J0R4L2_XENTR|nr:uncharacterized protein LOC116406448 isoform X2 [Xenopus tropicalis]|eukprot:XP_004914995.1 PREDICTED: uncharacterized protein LOC101734820 isoform X2 [Xenopus tropicalis]